MPLKTTMLALLLASTFARAETPTVWMVYDIRIEGKSMVKQYRAQIAAILSNASCDDLFGKLRAEIVSDEFLQTDGAIGLAAK